MNEQSTPEVRPELLTIKPLTALELKRSYVYLPEKLFKLNHTPMEFGRQVMKLLYIDGLGTVDRGIPMLGYAFCAGLSPVELAVLGYLSYDVSAADRTIAKKRRLPVSLVRKAIGALVDLGLIEQQADSRRLATLEDLLVEEAGQ